MSIASVTTKDGAVVSLSSDGSATYTKNGQTVSATTGTGRILQIVGADGGVVALFEDGAAYFSPDGQHLDGAGKTVRATDANPPGRILQIVGAGGGVVALFQGGAAYFSPDGRNLDGAGQTIRATDNLMTLFSPSQNSPPLHSLSAELPYTSPNANDRDGDTTATVWAVVNQQGNQSSVDLHVYVKKTGISGTGCAYGKAVLFDSQGSILYQTPIHTTTKGANANPFHHPGLAEDATSKTFPLSASILSQATKVGIVAKADDTSGGLSPPNLVAEVGRLVNAAVDIYTSGLDAYETAEVLITLFA